MGSQVQETGRDETRGAGTGDGRGSGAAAAPAAEPATAAEPTPAAAPTPAPAPTAGLEPADVLDILTRGELTITGRLTNASNATLFGTVRLDGVELECVHKPIAGERPLWDFPDGTLANREVAAFEVSEATGWRIVPATVMREGPWGAGMCQLWIDTDPEDQGIGDDSLLTLLPPERADEPGWRRVLSVELEDGEPAFLAHRDDERLRRVAAFDVVINNADRKGGHLLVPAGEPGHVHGIDHGIAFHAEDKLRTLLWGFADDELAGEVREVLTGLDADLASGIVGRRLGELLEPGEVEATRERVRGLLRAGAYPGPGRRPRPVPWPPF